MRRSQFAPETRRAALASTTLALLSAALSPMRVFAINWPVTEQQRSTAEKVAQGGVALADLAPNAPDTYTVKTGDTLWDISSLYLKSPWRWPELWGMNLEQVRNPHLIYPGQVLYLDKADGFARLRTRRPGEGEGEGQGEDVGVVGGTLKLSPKSRSRRGDSGPIASIPFHLIEPFLNEAVIFGSNELAAAPRIVAAQEGRVLLGSGDTAYVRGPLEGRQRDYRVFRNPKPLRDPETDELLGYEAVYVGTAQYTAPGTDRRPFFGTRQITPATFKLMKLRLEAEIGDRLAVVPPSESSNYSPRAPRSPIAGQIASIYGEGVYAGQNQIVALNKGMRDDLETGHVLALWRSGPYVTDPTERSLPRIRLPDERHGLLFVFRVFERMSYALILTVREPVQIGDIFTPP
ncbi:MAG: LysM peptidoglycan-binding domain-containing protein [Burkholderiales bacterium]|jgi:nucleoid-associated protein YgaU|nr:LysM peptidoglycan-binding domain-containing protein [Burkholderiales bacterium]